VPLSKAARAAVSGQPKLIAAVLTGGDDFEVVATVSPRKLNAFRAAASRARVDVTEIGRITADKAVEFLGPDSRPLRFARASFSHF